MHLRARAMEHVFRKQKFFGTTFWCAAGETCVQKNTFFFETTFWCARAETCVKIFFPTPTSVREEKHVLQNLFCTAPSSVREEKHFLQKLFFYCTLQCARGETCFTKIFLLHPPVCAPSLGADPVNQGRGVFFPLPSRSALPLLSDSPPHSTLLPLVM